MAASCKRDSNSPPHQESMATGNIFVNNSLQMFTVFWLKRKMRVESASCVTILESRKKCWKFHYATCKKNPSVMLFRPHWLPGSSIVGEQIPEAPLINLRRPQPWCLPNFWESTPTWKPTKLWKGAIWKAKCFFFWFRCAVQPWATGNPVTKRFSHGSFLAGFTANRKGC